MLMAVDGGCGLRLATSKVLKPSARLAGVVHHYDYWETACDSTMQRPFAVSLLPMVAFFLGCPGEAFEYGRGRQRVLPRVLAVGPCDHRVAEVRDVGPCRNFTIIFQPAGFYSLFHVSPESIRNDAHDGGDVLGARMARLGERLRAMTDPVAMVAAVEAELLPKMAGALDGRRMRWAAGELIEGRGSVDLAALAEKVRLSDSSWRRQFNCQIGFAPKHYLRMVRFRHAVSLKKADPDLPWTRLCLEAGYYDQSHCIAEFHEMAGVAPSRYMQEIAGLPERWIGRVASP
jgi:AraC-like DNA-binding protein